METNQNDLNDVYEDVNEDINIDVDVDVNKNSESSENPFNGIIRSFKTTKFESAEIREDLTAKITNDNGEIDKALYNELTDTHTIKIRVDFSDVSIDEYISNFLLSTTSVGKMIQNNVLKGKTEDEILTLAQNGLEIRVRDLLDSRSKKVADPKTMVKNLVKKAKDKGQSKADILAMLDELF